MAYIISELKHKIIPYPKDNLNSGWDKKRKKRFTSINSIWKRNVALAYNVHGFVRWRLLTIKLQRKMNKNIKNKTTDEGLSEPSHKTDVSKRLRMDCS